MKNCMNREIYQFFTVIKRCDGYVIRQIFLLYFCHFVFESSNDFLGVFTFAHDNNTFYYVICIISSHLSQSWLIIFVNMGQIFDEDRCSINILDNDISNFLNIINHTDTSYHIGLRTFLYYITSDIYITLGNSFIQF